MTKNVSNAVLLEKINHVIEKQEDMAKKLEENNKKTERVYNTLYEDNGSKCLTKQVQELSEVSTKTKIINWVAVGLSGLVVALLIALLGFTEVVSTAAEILRRTT